jgi:hypothetical protein
MRRYGITVVAVSREAVPGEYQPRAGWLVSAIAVLAVLAGGGYFHRVSISSRLNDARAATNKATATTISAAGSARSSRGPG